VTVAAPHPSEQDGWVRQLDLRLTLVVAMLVLVGYGVSLGDDFQLGLSNRGAGRFPIGPWALLEDLVGTLPLAFRRVTPILVFVLVGIASLVNEALNRRPEPLPLAVLVALYTVVVYRRPLISGIAAAGYLTALVVASLVGWETVTDEQFYINTMAVVGTVTLGYGVALNRARARLAERRTDELSRDVEAQTREAVEREQARIAREMHDILTHHLSVIVAQAAAAQRVLAQRPRAAAEALGSIESVGREALSGLRRLVGLLRVDRDQPDRSPQPGLDRLDSLVDQVRRAGLQVELTIRGRRRPLPAAVELNAFRLIQEALTNSLKHAARTRATVTLTYGDESLHIDVSDTGSPPGARPPAADAVRDQCATAGYGLISMQQRVALLGGELTVGPEGGRGFHVRARLPLDGRRTSHSVVT